MSDAETDPHTQADQELQQTAEEALAQSLRFMALASVKGLGPVAVQQLLALAEQEGVSPDQPSFWPLCHKALSCRKSLTHEVLNQLQQRWQSPMTVAWPQRDQVLSWLKQPGQRRLLALGQQGYPYLLGQTEDPPLLLFLQGDHQLLHRPQLAIVGARRPTAMGMSDARAFAGALTELGWTITSGLAEGIDACAHQGALQAAGRTIAVLGTGIDRCYPARHKPLQQQIADQGLLVSEYPLGTPPKGPNFPRRNRIVSGLSVGLLVVEAALKSGSLISARLANEQGREVFAIPGSIHQAQSKGCHQLIKNGAKLTETVMDIHEELAHWLQSASGVPLEDTAQDQKRTDPEPSLFSAARQTTDPQPVSKKTTATSARLRSDFSSDEAYRIWQAVSKGADSTDALVLACESDPIQISQHCLLLEMQGLLVQRAGRWQIC